MIRPKYEDLEAWEWTPEEAEHHLTQTFDYWVEHRPDAMERYLALMPDTGPERIMVMRTALRETMVARYGEAPTRH